MSKEYEGVIKKKWDSIRSAYIRSKKILPSGSGTTQKIYKYARMLSFLDDTHIPRA